MIKSFDSSNKNCKSNNTGNTNPTTLAKTENSRNVIRKILGRRKNRIAQKKIRVGNVNLAKDNSSIANKQMSFEKTIKIWEQTWFSNCHYCKR